MKQLVFKRFLGACTCPLKRPVAALFPGQASQYVGMGKDLVDRYPAARRTFDEANDALGLSLTDVAFNGPAETLKQTSYAQPAILVTSAAILAVLKEEAGFDITKQTSFILGHSLGEYTALYAAGALSFADAVRLVHKRGKAMEESLQSNLKTSMVALIMRPNKLGELAAHVEAVQSTLQPGEVVDLSNVNSATQAVLSGSFDAVERTCKSLQAARIAARAVELPVSAPFHCKLMQSAADTMLPSLHATSWSEPKVPVVSNVTVQPFASAAAIPDLLVKQITGTVQWHDSIAFCRNRGVHDFLVFGPNRALSSLLKKDYPADRVCLVESAEDIAQVVRGRMLPA
ncbi:[acyl-carrier-protein] S-malonyltransferase [Blastocladiella emersonii ATCC 22665]|nr:[acyl-carrier-protein] S-malonyltransferase [Blastocladiella emersonii ATCC 22665]